MNVKEKESTACNATYSINTADPKLSTEPANQHSTVVDDAKDAGSDDFAFDEKVKVEMEKAKEMKIGDLKLKLQAKGILTSNFCEKSEFVRAYSEMVVKDSEKNSDTEQPKQEPSVVRFAENSDTDGHSSEDELEDGIMDELPVCVRHRVHKLQELEEDREKIVKEYLEERAKLEAKYHTLTKPLYEKRRDIVRGKMDDDIEKEHGGVGKGNGNNEGPKGIPQFWVCALGHMDVVAEMLTEPDIACLEHLQDVTCHDDDNGEGFTLSFYFADNDYFENTVLTKRYEVPNLLLADEPILKHVEGCEIKWKPGKSLTYKEVTKTQRGTGKNAGQLRTITKKETIDSFFHFFTPPEMPCLDAMNEDEAARLEKAFDADYDVAQALRSHVIPKAVLWFTGHAMEKEMEAAMEGMDWPGEGAEPTGDENPECKQS